MTYNYRQIVVRVNECSHCHTWVQEGSEYCRYHHRVAQEWFSPARPRRGKRRGIIFAPVSRCAGCAEALPPNPSYYWDGEAEGAFCSPECLVTTKAVWESSKVGFFRRLLAKVWGF